MADGTKIEWTDATINPIRAHRVVRAADGSVAETRPGWHCEHVSEACRNCYAEAINRDRFGTGLGYKPGHLTSGEVEIIFVEGPIREMLKWRRPRRIFVCSMTDLFADFVPDWMIDRVFAAAALAPQHTVQILTKRPERMREYIMRLPRRSTEVADEAHLSGVWPSGCRQIEQALSEPIRNVWLGVTAENQRGANERVPVLLDTPAIRRFVSIEPMLGPIDLTELVSTMPRGEHHFSALECDVDPADDNWSGHILDWVICGGESGPNARPMHPDWVRSLRDQCAATMVPFLFKQWGAWFPVLDRDRDDPDWRADYSRHERVGNRIVNLEGGTGFHGERVHVMRRQGKRAAGRLLDGLTHDAFPEG